MNLFIFEFFSGGGMSNQSLPDEILVEGRALLTRLLHDFSELDEFNILTSLDERIAIQSDLQREFPAEQRFIVKHNPGKSDEDQYLSLFSDLLDQANADLVLLMAPEIDNILVELTRIVEEKELINLNSTSSAVDKFGDKWRSYNLLNSAGIPQPVTLHFDEEFKLSLKEFIDKGEIDFPLMIKPRDGAGSEVLYLDSIAEIDKIDERDYEDRKLIVQKFHTGLSASVSVISNGKEVVPLSLNRQFLSPIPDFTYLGGKVGIEHSLKQEIFAMIKKMPELISGLKGYLGVDLILTEDEFWVIEINPRLTTSYLGLSYALQRDNLAEMIIKAVLNQKLPDYPLDYSPVVFNKDGRLEPQAGDNNE